MYQFLLKLSRDESLKLFWFILNIKYMHLLMWCSPGFGLIDTWLPVIKKLKENNKIRIDFVFPEPSSLILEDKNSDLFKLK